MAMYGMKGLNDIFRGKVPGLPKLDNDEDRVEKVTDNIMTRKLNLKEKGEALNFKFSNKNADNNLFKTLHSSKPIVNTNFQQYLKFGNKTTQENKVWQVLKPKQLRTDKFSRNMIVSPGNEDLVPDTQDVRAWAGQTEEVPTQEDASRQQALLQALQTGVDVVDTRVVQPIGRFGKYAGQRIKQKALEKYSKYKQEKQDIADEQEREQAMDRLVKVKQRDARRQALSDPDLYKAIEKKRLEYNLDLAYRRKLKDSGLVSAGTGARRVTIGKGKNKQTLLISESGGVAPSQQEGLLSNSLPRNLQGDWRKYVSSNLPGSEASISGAIRGGALVSRDEQILRAIHSTNSSDNVMYAARTGGSTQQLLSTIKSYDNVSFPGTLSGPDKIRWMLASPQQRQEMLQILQQQPAPVVASPPVQQQSTTYAEPVQQVTERQVPPGATYSPYSKKPVTYVRGPYRKRQ